MTEHQDDIPRPEDTTEEAISPAPSPRSSADPLIGTKIGSCTIKRIIGSGGMGTVYEAVQEKPRRRVALKMMKRGITSRSATRRFEFESQTLARLQHPGVAQIYEAGTHDDGSGGVPYFVMEYVASAKTITQYADDKKFGTKDRLALFSKVCDAVQHGHLKGIVHRDLKPGNILVDSSGQPKVIDFGVARSTDSDMAVTTLQTDVGQLIGTLQYMSPEQCEADPMDIDARSDVYALGVILYELLIGKPPYNLQRMAIHEAVRIVREEEPTKLSTIDRHLRGDIETIAMKALEKDRDRRYQSATALENDIKCYLNDEPISARAPGAIDYLRRFARKHTAAAIAIVAVFVVLLGSMLAISIYAVEAERQGVAAKVSEQEAIQERTYALRQVYYGNIHAAAGAINQDERTTAKRRLDAARDATVALQFHDATASARRPLTLDSWVTIGTFDDMPFEWKYLHAKNDDSLAELKGHEGGVTSVAFSPDGSRIVSGSFDETLRVWDVASGEELAVLKGHEGGVTSVAFSPDGLRIVSSGDNTVRVWDVASREELAELKGHEGSVNSVAFSPDGLRIVSGSADKTVRVWDVASREELAVLKGHEGGVTSVAFSPDGSRIVSGSTDGTLRVWDVASGEELAELKRHEMFVLSVAFSPDGSRIVSGSADKTVRVWDVASREELAVLKGHESYVRSVAFSPDGSRIVSGSFDETLRVWDVASEEELAVLGGHEWNVSSVAFSPDGSRIVSGGSDCTVRVWDVASGEELAVLKDHEGNRDRTHSLPVASSVAFSPDGSRIVSGSTNGTLRVWDVATGEELAELKGHEMYVTSVAFSPDGSRIVSSGDNTVRVWDAATGEELAVLEGHGMYLTSVAFSPDGSRIVSGSTGGTVFVWDTSSGYEFDVLGGHEGSVNSVAFSPDGLRIVSGSADKTVRVWDVASREELDVLAGHESSVRFVAFSPDGLRIVSGSGTLGALDIVRLWDVASGEELPVLKGQLRAYSVAFSPDGLRIVSGNYDATVRVRDVASGEELAVLRGHENSVLFVAFSPDGSRIVSVGGDSTIRLWNTKSRGHIAHERRLALRRNASLSPVVDSWIEKTQGDSELVLSMLDREIKNRPLQEVITLRNLVLKKLVEQRQAKQKQDTDD